MSQFIHFKNRYCPVCQQDLCNFIGTTITSGHFDLRGSFVDIQGEDKTALCQRCVDCDDKMNIPIGACYGVLQPQHGLIVSAWGDNEHEGGSIPILDDKGQAENVTW